MRSLDALDAKQFPRLAHFNARFASGDGAALVVSCTDCAMTMHASSENCRVDNITRDLVCTDCAYNRQERH